MLPPLAQEGGAMSDQTDLSETWCPRCGVSWDHHQSGDSDACVNALRKRNSELRQALVIANTTQANLHAIIEKRQREYDIACRNWKQQAERDLAAEREKREKLLFAKEWWEKRAIAYDEAYAATKRELDDAKHAARRREPVARVGDRRTAGDVR